MINSNFCGFKTLLNEIKLFLYANLYLPLRGVRLGAFLKLKLYVLHRTPLKSFSDFSEFFEFPMCFSRSLASILMNLGPKIDL